MVTFLAWLLAGILFVLSTIHIYWLFGGTKGIKVAIPTKEKDQLFIPSHFATTVVAILLAIAGLVVLLIGKIVSISFIPQLLINSAGWGLAIVFLGRTIGDFRWLGVFKKNKDTLFAKWDTQLFSPLCFIISVGVSVLLIS